MEISRRFCRNTSADIRYMLKFLPPHWIFCLFRLFFSKRRISSCIFYHCITGNQHWLQEWLLLRLRWFRQIQILQPFLCPFHIVTKSLFDNTFQIHCQVSFTPDHQPVGIRHTHLTNQMCLFRQYCLTSILMIIITPIVRDLAEFILIRFRNLITITRAFLWSDRIPIQFFNQPVQTEFRKNMCAAKFVADTSYDQFTVKNRNWKFFQKLCKCFCTLNIDSFTVIPLISFRHDHRSICWYLWHCLQKCLSQRLNAGTSRNLFAHKHMSGSFLSFFITILHHTLSFYSVLVIVPLCPFPKHLQVCLLLCG